MPMTGAPTSHLVLIPSYNPDHKANDIIRSACVQWNPIWVVTDGSTDGNTERLQAMTA